ncbi:fibroblast growth factor 23-like [Salvelinus alpinus]|uniref:fibroblast growth factor 23-like n=1 Tax=Salvelinus alpinus TaxID=8036 RepID=UPI0039FB9DE1
MEITNTSGMRDAVLVLLLAVLLGFRLVDALPNPSPLIGSNWGNPRRRWTIRSAEGCQFASLQTSSDVNNFYIEISLNGHLRKTTLRGSYSVILLKAETRERVAILGVKSNRYLCMDALGNPFSSTVCHKKDCPFNHKLLENHRDVYYSCRTGILLNLEGIKQVYTVSQNLPQTSLFLSEMNTVPLERLLHREKRNRVVDSSDPYSMLGQTEEDEDSRAMTELDDTLEMDQEAELPEGCQSQRLPRRPVERAFPKPPSQPPYH